MPHSTGSGSYSKLVFGRSRPEQEPMVISDGKHKKCKASKCDKGVARYTKDGVVMWSPHWCTNHVCHVGPDRCDHRKSSKALYCIEHATCKALGCTVEPNDLSKRVLPWYCPQHQCSYRDSSSGHQCPKPMQDGSSYCHGHTKDLRKMQRAKLAEMRCAVQECPYRRESESWYCSLHKCRECHDLGDQDGLCSKHQPQPCSTPGCDRPRARLDNDQLADFCSGHTRCKEHSSGCDAIILAATTYCDVHRCRIKGCDYKRDQSLEAQNAYCRIHSCIEDGCTQPTASHDDSRYRRCTHHTCGIEDCYTKALIFKGYCQVHTCEKTGCYGSIKGRHRFCAHHECRDTACLAPAKHSGGYCAERKHACEHKGCTARSGDAEYPNFCESHARTMIRQAGIEEGRRATESQFEKRTADLESTLSEVYMWASSTSDEAERLRAQRFMDKGKLREPRTFADDGYPRRERSMPDDDDDEWPRSPHDWERERQPWEREFERNYGPRLHPGGFRYVPKPRHVHAK